MADMTTIKGRIAETIYPNGTGAITAESHQALLLEMADTFNALKVDEAKYSRFAQETETAILDVNESIELLEKKVENLPGTSGDFDPSGKYPDLIAGDLVGRGESVPAEFSFRASGGKSIKDGRAYIKRIKGNSVVWNQQVNHGYVSGDTVINDVGSGIPQGHKFILSRTKAIGGTYYFTQQDNYSYVLTDGEYAKIFNQSTEILLNQIYCTAESGYVRLTDLTQMFGAGNEPTTIEEFYARKPIVADEYAYNEGEVIHMTAEGIKSVGDNAWDEEWENGTFSIVTGENINNSYVDSQIRTKNLIRVLPNETYCLTISQASIWAVFYDAEGNLIEKPVGSFVADNAINIKNAMQFSTPTNAAYMKFYAVVEYGTTYNNDIMITLVHSGWKQDTDAGYQPYWQDTLPLPIISKYFPGGMKKAGSAHDEIRFNKESGKWEAVQRIGSVDLGTLTWELSEFNGHSVFYSGRNELGAMYADGIFYLCAKYQSAAYRIYTEGLDKSIALNNGYYSNRDEKDFIVIRDTSYTDATTFKAAMQGVILYYELAEPIVTELDEADQNFRDYYKVADFGTEQAIAEQPSAPISADIIYQFNAVDMIREHEIEINELQSIIATMQAQLASLTSNNG